MFKPTRLLQRVLVSVLVMYVVASLTHTSPGDLFGDAISSGRQLIGTQRPQGPAASIPGAQAAVVDRVVDGDTVVVTVLSAGALRSGRQATVRMLEIDTPETKKPAAPVACGGPAASAFTKHLLPHGTQVTLVADRELNDRYGRALRYVYLRDGSMVNLRIARAGYARALYIAPNDAHIAQVRRVVARAQAAHRGMWSTCLDPFAPAR